MSKSFSQDPCQKMSQLKRNSHRSLPILISACRRFGCICFLWCVLVYDDPATHPWINITEKEYIISSLAQQAHINSTFSRDLVSVSEFIRVTTNMWACPRSYYSDQNCFQVNSTSSSLFLSKLWSDRLPLWSMCVCCFSHQWLINIIIICTNVH